MKKIRILLVVFALLVIILSACQPTPDVPFVVGKDSDEMINKATQNDEKTTNDATEGLKETLNVPDVIRLEKDSKKGYLHLNINAKVLVPDTTKMPIYRVAITPFTQNQVDRIVEVLMKNKPIFCFDESQIGNTMTKAQLEKILIDAKKDYASGDFEKVGMTKEELEEKIKSLQEQISVAPNDLSDMATTPSNGELIKNVDGSEMLDVFADLGETRFAHLRIINDVPGKDVSCMFSQHLDLIEKNNYTQQEAQDYADELLSKLGVNDMGVIYNRFFEHSQTYNLIYARLIDGNVVYNIQGNPQNKGSEYSVPWDHERIDISIGANGVTRFEWISPYEMRELITDDANLLPFDDIEKRISDIFFSFYTEETVFGDNPYIDITYNIENIQLCLIRIDEQDSEMGLIIPVWLICGKDYGESDMRYGINIAATSELLLIINAIDGSLF